MTASVTSAAGGMQPVSAFWRTVHCWAHEGRAVSLKTRSCWAEAATASDATMTKRRMVDGWMGVCWMRVCNLQPATRTGRQQSRGKRGERQAYEAVSTVRSFVQIDEGSYSQVCAKTAVAMLLLLITRGAQECAMKRFSYSIQTGSSLRLDFRWSSSFNSREGTKVQRYLLHSGSKFRPVRSPALSTPACIQEDPRGGQERCGLQPDSTWRFRPCRASCHGYLLLQGDGEVKCLRIPAASTSTRGAANSCNKLPRAGS
jgi:hypothetical protein